MKLPSSLTLAIAMLVGATNIPATAETPSVLTVTNQTEYSAYVSFHQLGPTLEYVGQPSGRAKVAFHFPGRVWGIAYESLKERDGSEICLASRPITLEEGTTSNLVVTSWRSEAEPGHRPSTFCMMR